MVVDEGDDDEGLAWVDSSRAGIAAGEASMVLV